MSQSTSTDETSVVSAETSIVSALVASQHACPVERELLEAEVAAYFLPMAHALARRYSAKGVDLEDLEQVADLALVKAMRRFDPAAGNLRGYVSATVLGEIKRHFRDHAWTVRPPRHIQDLQSRVMDALEDVRDEVPGQSRVARVAQLLGLDRGTVSEVLVARGLFRSSSLDRPVGHGELTLADQLTDTSEPLDDLEAHSFLRYVCEVLDDDARELLRLRFVEGLSQQEIATRTSCTQKQVSRQLTRILTVLRERATAAEAA